MADTSDLSPVELTYFTENGKYKYFGKYPWTEVQKRLNEDVPPAHKVFDLIRHLQRCRELPGLKSGSWFRGPILISGEWPGGYPQLLMPL